MHTCVVIELNACMHVFHFELYYIEHIIFMIFTHWNVQYWKTLFTNLIFTSAIAFDAINYVLIAANYLKSIHDRLFWAFFRRFAPHKKLRKVRLIFNFDTVSRGCWEEKLFHFFSSNSERSWRSLSNVKLTSGIFLVLVLSSLAEKHSEKRRKTKTKCGVGKVVK